MASTRLERGEVHVWQVELEVARREEGWFEGLLSEDERDRAARFAFEAKRTEYVLTRGVLRTLAGRYLGRDPARVRFDYGERKKPALAPESTVDLTFNVAHSGGLAILAFGRQTALGVDVEFVRGDVDAERLARRFFSPSERDRVLGRQSRHERLREFFRGFVRKEAYVKARGDGLYYSLTSFAVHEDAGTRALTVSNFNDPAESPRWWLCDLPSRDGFVAALAAAGRPTRVAEYWWREGGGGSCG